MPRFNQRGRVTPQIGYHWYDQERFVYQDCSTGVCKIVLSDGTVEARHAANMVTGNPSASFWAAWLNRDEGAFDQDGRSFPLAGLGPMGPDGAYPIKVDYWSYGPWDVIERDGSRWRLTEGDADSIQLLGGRRAIWTEGGRLRSTPGLTIVGDPGAPLNWPRVTADGLLLYQHRPDGSLVLGGHVIGPPSAFYFYPDVLLLDGIYHVTWSPNQADTNAQTLVLTPAQLEALPLIGAEGPPPSPEVPRIGRALWCGWFVFGTASDVPSNCALPVTAPMLVRAKDGTVLAQYVASEGLGADLDLLALEAAIAAAKLKLPGVPTLCYWTPAAQQRRVPIGAEHVGVEAYRRLGEPLADFEARVRASVARCPRAWLIAQCYTSNASLDPDLAVLVPVYARIARDCQNVIGILAFSAGFRATGWGDHREAQPAWRALFAGITGTPHPAPVPPPVPPPAPKPTPPAPPPAPPPKENDPMIGYSAPVPGFLPGDLVDNGNGTVSVKKPNGRYLCVTPNGTIEERDSPGGAWESFRRGKSSLIAERDGDAAGPKVYVLGLAE